MAKYTLWVPHTVILLPHATEIGCIESRYLSLSLPSSLLELSTFKCTFEYSEGSLAVQGRAASCELYNCEEEVGTDFKFLDIIKDVPINEPSSEP